MLALTAILVQRMNALYFDEPFHPGVDIQSNITWSNSIILKLKELNKTVLVVKNIFSTDE